ncbi:short-chain dehydrogenase/reductase [Leptolyngbya sp. 'hensonii']|uniref:SDR family NAD(P)-dependent oxidoreductase n=1 Tax=Leptolyngbya sp. 'hensonii' TaxID=1922337 RepID=UPI00094F9AF9|nr:SDR family oxidoreductase [Leptolyngbya sp. 'hensonii']OLP17675.1 short-chain dehydrogenase/reductase [Leptolyngbya sp. 'hensonii']
MTISLPLPEQVVLITGASTGIGAALAKVLAKRYPGIRLVLAARSREKLMTIAETCRLAGAEVAPVPTDFAQIEQAQALARTALETFGRVDILVNNAGYGQMGPIELMPPAAVQNQFQVNLFGPLALTQALIPALREQGGGRILNVSSLGGRIAFPFGGLYSGSKFALEALSDALRMELEAFNIQVSVIEPGPVTTPFFQVVAEQIQQIIPHPFKTPYAAAFRNLETLEQQTSSRAWTSEQVAEVILQAITDRTPRPRYVAATQGDLMLFVMRKVLPTKVVDRFWQRFYALDKVAQEWRTRSPN